MVRSTAPAHCTLTWHGRFLCGVPKPVRRAVAQSLNLQDWRRRFPRSPRKGGLWNPIVALAVPASPTTTCGNRAPYLCQGDLSTVRMFARLWTENKKPPCRAALLVRPSNDIYARSLRRITPASPDSPVPSSSKLDGSGTVPGPGPAPTPLKPALPKSLRPLP